MTTAQLMALKLHELRAMCREQKLRGYSDACKADCVAMLQGEALPEHTKKGAAASIKATAKAYGISSKVVPVGTTRATIAAASAKLAAIVTRGPALEDMTVVALKAICQANKDKYRGFSKHTRKADLIAFIRSVGYTAQAA